MHENLHQIPGFPTELGKTRINWAGSGKLPIFQWVWSSLLLLVQLKIQSLTLVMTSVIHNIMLLLSTMFNKIYGVNKYNMYQYYFSTFMSVCEEKLIIFQELFN